MKLTEPWFPGYETVVLSAGGGGRLYGVEGGAYG